MATINAVNSTLSGTTGSGSFVGNNSPTIDTPIIGGVINGSISSSGIVGEIISSVVLSTSPVAITGVAQDITSILLTPGDWDVYGNIYILNSGTIVNTIMWVSDVSATQPDLAYVSTEGFGSVVSSFGFDAPDRTFNVTSNTTVYLSVDATLTLGTAYACGTLFARRRR